MRSFEKLNVVFKPLLRIAISRHTQSDEDSDVSDYHHGDEDTPIDGMAI